MVEETVIELILEHSPIQLSFTKENKPDWHKMRLTTDLGYNSISLIVLIVELERKFSVEFDDEMLLMENLDSVQAILANIDSLLKK